MTYEEAKPFAERLYDMAMWYHAKPNEFKRRVYEVIDDIAKAKKQEFGDTSAAYMVGVQDGKKQRKWVGLTQAERHDIREWQKIQEELGPVWSPMMLYFYEAIETKLKEKNGG